MTYDATTGKVSIPNLAGVRYADSYAWSQFPGSDLTSPGSGKTITLAPCPLGIDVSNNANAPYAVRISTVGTPEAVPVTGGTCTPGGASGTIIVTTSFTHAGGYTVGSASTGLQEAINDGCIGGQGNCQVQGQPASGTNPNYDVYATVYVKSASSGGYKVHFIGNGAYVNCHTRDVCFFNGVRAGQKTVYNLIQGWRFKTDLQVDGAQITGLSAAAGTYTATAASHPFVTGDYASIEFYSPGGSSHTVRQVTVTDSSHFTFTLGGLTFSNTAPTWGWANIENAAIEDDAQGSVIRDIDFAGALAAGGNWNGFSYGIVVDNDQNANFEHITNSNGALRCTTNFCGAYFFGRGDQGANGTANAGIMHISDTDISGSCAGNGVLGRSGNGLSITNSVIQGFNQFAVRYDGGLQGATIPHLYTEVGACTNPQYPGSLQAQAGALGQQFTIIGDAPIAGTSPLFANTGANRRNYFIVPQSTSGTTFGYGPLLFAGYATTNNAGTVNVYWPQVVGDGGAGTINYDVLVTLGTNAVPPYLGNANSLATGISGSCTNGICTFADTHAASSAYTVHNQTWFPHLYFWPGAYAGSDNTNRDASFGVPLQFNLSRLVTSSIAGYASSFGTKIPSAFVNNCTRTQVSLSPSFIVCQNGPSTSLVATVLQQAGAVASPAANSKGRLNFGPTLGNLPIHIVTLCDSNISKTLATDTLRPSNDPNDCFFGMDQSGGMSMGAQNSVSLYIGNIGDNTAWLARLTSSALTVKVPVTVNDGTGGVKISGPCGTVPASGSASLDVFGFDSACDPVVNKANATFNRKLIPQDYTFAGLPAANAVDTGQLAVITDASTSTCPVTVGGGSARVLVRSNGTTWDGVCGAGSNGITVSLYSARPGSPVNNQLAVFTDWNGSCPVTAGTGSEGVNQFVRYNSGTAQWKCVRDGTLPFVTTAQIWDGAGAGGIHFGIASTPTNTSDQNDLHLDSTGNLLEWADNSGPPGVLYKIGMYAATASLPSAGNFKCAQVDSNGYLTFTGVACLAGTLATLTSNYTNSTTSLSDVTGLSFPISAPNISITCNLVYSVGTNTATPNFAFSGPASPTSVYLSGTIEDSTGALLIQTTPVIASGFGTATTNSTTTTISTNYAATLVVNIRNGATPGTAQLRAKANGAGTLTILAGSTCNLSR